MDREYQLIRSKRKTISLQITPQATLVVRAPRFVEVGYINRLIQRKQGWITKKMEQIRSRPQKPAMPEAEIKAWRKQARPVLQECLERWSNVMGLRYKSFRLSSAKTRWGSCSGLNVISLNWKLILTAPELIDYVAIHELAHVKHKNHSTDFWALVERYDPDWKQHRQELNRQAAALNV